MQNAAPSADTKQQAKVATAVPWSVVVFDDPVNLMAYVTFVLKSVFGYDAAKAEKFMLEIHHAGKAIVWTGEKEQAELYVQQLHAHQLKASMQKASE